MEVCYDSSSDPLSSHNNDTTTTAFITTDVIMMMSSSKKSDNNNNAYCDHDDVDDDVHSSSGSVVVVDSHSNNTSNTNSCCIQDDTTATSDSTTTSTTTTTTTKDRLACTKTAEKEKEPSASSSSSSSSSSLSLLSYYAKIALALSVEEWTSLGIISYEQNNHIGCTDNIDIIVDRITSLLVIRLIAIVASRSGNNDNNDNNMNDTMEGSVDANNNNNNNSSRCHVVYDDYSTSTICRTILFDDMDDPIIPKNNNNTLSTIITSTVMNQLRQYVQKMITGYNNVPYHNREHAFHVVLSINKFLDMMVSSSSKKQTTVTTTSSSSCCCRRPPTFGLRNDPIQLCALVFAALIHDVEHLGIPNRQLVIESDALAIQYNDLSVAEQRSLYIGFYELLKTDYNELRTVMFNTASVGTDAEYYRKFRTTVVHLVFNTDIASPERAQLSKSKFKEAFGDKILRTTTTTTTINKNDNDNNNNAAPTTNTSAVEEEEVKDQQYSQNEMTEEQSQPHQRRSLDSSEYTVASTRESSSTLDYNDDDDDDDDDDNDGVIFSSSTNKNNGLRNTAAQKTTWKNQKQMIESLQVVDDNNSKRMMSQSARGGGDEEDSKKYNYGSNEDNDSERNRRASTGGVVVSRFRNRSSSLPGSFAIPIHLIQCRMQLQNHGSYPRRMSAPHLVSYTSTYRKRLGIRRSMDLSGEAIENFPKPQRNYSTTSNDTTLGNDENDQPDELKASVVLDLIITAADVAHNLQGWDQMVKWSGRLYMELRKAYIDGRSTFDPQMRWYENQIGFLESYLLTLADRLDQTGVFSHHVNFASIVASNRDKWITDGIHVTQSIVAAGEDRFPSQKNTLKS